MDKLVTITPVESGRFKIQNNSTNPNVVFDCYDADSVGEYIETAMWPLLKPALKSRQKIKITIEYEQEKSE